MITSAPSIAHGRLYQNGRKGSGLRFSVVKLQMRMPISCQRLDLRHCPRFCDNIMVPNQLRPAYRLFAIDGHGRVNGVPDIIEAPSDVQAVQAAEKLARSRTVELWRGTRLVTTLNGKGRS